MTRPQAFPSFGSWTPQRAATALSEDKQHLQQQFRRVLPCYFMRFPAAFRAGRRPLPTHVPTSHFSLQFADGRMLAFAPSIDHLTITRSFTTPFPLDTPLPDTDCTTTGYARWHNLPGPAPSAHTQLARGLPQANNAYYLRDGFGHQWIHTPHLSLYLAWSLGGTIEIYLHNPTKPRHTLPPDHALHWVWKGDSLKIIKTHIEKTHPIQCWWATLLIVFGLKRRHT